MKILSTQYGPHSLTVRVTAPADLRTILKFKRNQKVIPHLKFASEADPARNYVASAESSGMSTGKPTDPTDPTDDLEPSSFRINFPPGQGWQTLEFTLAW